MTNRLDTDPLTLVQLGAIHGEFRRLGFDPADRAGRLEVTAALARVSGGIESTRELTMGEAGRVIGALRDCPGRAELAARLAPPPTLAVLIRRVLAAIFTTPKGA